MPPEKKSSGLAKWVAFGFATLLFAFWCHDFYRWQTKTGLYVTEYQGEVVKLRPTWKHLVELVDGDSHTSTTSDDGYNRGRYAATLTGDDGAERVVGLSWRDFTRATKPGYLVCHQGQLQVFATRAEAEAAGAVAPLQ